MAMSQIAQKSPDCLVRTFNSRLEMAIKAGELYLYGREGVKPQKKDNRQKMGTSPRRIGRSISL
jgi:hypothetical protein